MKKYLIFLAIFFVGCLVYLSSCRKYEDGPTLSLTGKAERVKGYYTFDKVWINDSDKTSDYTKQSIEFTKKGRFSWIVVPGNIYGYGQMRINGNWCFTNNKNNLKLISDDSLALEFKIKKLTGGEIWITTIDTPTWNWHLWQLY